jgi:hypothetical protein
MFGERRVRVKGTAVSWRIVLSEPRKFEESRLFEIFAAEMKDIDSVSIAQGEHDLEACSTGWFNSGIVLLYPHESY